MDTAACECRSLAVIDGGSLAAADDTLLATEGLGGEETASDSGDDWRKEVEEAVLKVADTSALISSDGRATSLDEDGTLVAIEPTRDESVSDAVDSEVGLLDATDDGLLEGNDVDVFGLPEDALLESEEVNASKERPDGAVENWLEEALCALKDCALTSTCEVVDAVKVDMLETGEDGFQVSESSAEEDNAAADCGIELLVMTDTGGMELTDEPLSRLELNDDSAWKKRGSDTIEDVIEERALSALDDDIAGDVLDANEAGPLRAVADAASDFEVTLLSSIEDETLDLTEVVESLSDDKDSTHLLADDNSLTAVKDNLEADVGGVERLDVAPLGSTKDDLLGADADFAPARLDDGSAVFSDWVAPADTKKDAIKLFDDRALAAATVEGRIDSSDKEDALG